METYLGKTLHEYEQKRTKKKKSRTLLDYGKDLILQ